MDDQFDFGILLGLAYQSFVEALQEHMRGQGFDDLGRSYGYVFRALHDEDLQLNQLAERLGITNQGTLKIINEMESRGYVERHQDPQDGRAKRLRLAARGKAAVKAARRFHAAYEQNLRREHGAAALEGLRSLLGEMVADNAEAAHGRLRAM